MRQAKQETTRTRPGIRVAFTLLCGAALLTGCGGGGGGEAAPTADFQSTTIRFSANSVPVQAVRDNRSGIVWAAFLGQLPTGTGLNPRLPTAAELLQLTDSTTSADLRANFPFAFGPSTSKTLFEAQEKSNVQPGAVWVVDLGEEAFKGSMQSSVDFNATAQWYVLSPSTPSINAPSYTAYSSNGIAYSSESGLFWKLCAEGMTWNALTGSCDGVPSTLNQQQARLAIDNANAGFGFAGRTRWRLPTKQELQSLLVLSNQPPAPLILPAFNYDLQGTSWRTPYMTNTISTAGFFWSVSFDDGEVTPTADTQMPLHVRLVSSAR
jgi:hypothetical protein